MFTAPMSPASGFPRSWVSVRKLSDRVPLRVKLITALLALVVIALAVISFAGISFLRGYLISNVDQSLQGPNTERQAAHYVQEYQFDPSAWQPLSQTGWSVSWLMQDGQLQKLVVSSGPGSVLSGSVPHPASTAGPSLPGAMSWLAAHSDQPTTVRATSGSGHWRVVAFSLEDSSGNPLGIAIVGTDVSSIYTTIARLTNIDVVVSGVVLVVLAVIGAAVVRANLRPLDEIEETAEQIAAGHLDRRVPDRDPRTEVGSLGRSINAMLAQIEAEYHARQESEAAARRSEERMRQFIADASHELRTPLTALRGFAEYYRQRGGVQGEKGAPGATGPRNGTGAPDGIVPRNGLAAEDLDRIMHRVEDEATRMGVLVEDLVLLARLDQQRPLERQLVDMLVLAADAVHDTRVIAPSRQVTLTVQPGAVFLIIGDEARLRQVISNLTCNALKYTPDGTPIDVQLAIGALDPAGHGAPAWGKPVPGVILEVADQGPGLTPEQAQRVFERFYRADKARARKTGGSGLGLAIVDALVTAHGGTAMVHSVPGQGATFRICLPLAPDALARNRMEDEETGQPGIRG